MIPCSLSVSSLHDHRSHDVPGRRLSVGAQLGRAGLRRPLARQDLDGLAGLDSVRSVILGGTVVARVPLQQIRELTARRIDPETLRNLPNLEALQRNLDMTTDLGFVKGKVDVTQHTDLSIVKEAAARLK